MEWQPIVFELGFLISASLTAGIGFYAWSRRPTPGATSLARSMLAGALISSAANLIYLFKLPPFSEINVTLFAFTLTGLCISWGLFRYRSLHLVPLARDAIIASITDGMVVLDAQGRVVEINPAARLILNQRANDALGKPIAQIFQQLNVLKDWSASYGQPAELVLGAGEDQHTYQVRVQQLGKNTHTTGRLVLIRDITERKILEQRIAEGNEELEKQHRRQAALAKIGQAMNQTCKLGDVLECSVQVTAELVPASAGAAVVLWDEKTENYTVAASTVPELQSRVQSIRKNGGATRWVMDHREPLIVPDIREHSFDSNPILLEVGICAYAVVPLLANGKALGVLSALNRTPHRYTNEEIDLLIEIASRASTAVVKAHLLEQIERMATTDELTGVASRHHLFELGEREVNRARRFGHPLSAVMFDLDHFKRVNDAHGHPVGDQVLYAIAQAAIQSIREIDILGRYGGDEFAMLLPETDLSAACETAERIRKNIANLQVQTDGGPIHVTISLGVAEITEQTRDFTELIASADSARVKAKQAGRNRIYYADHSLARHFYLDFTPT